MERRSMKEKPSASLPFKGGFCRMSTKGGFNAAKRKKIEGGGQRQENHTLAFKNNPNIS